MKTANPLAPLLLAVVLSNSSLADDKQADFNRQLQQQVQASSQSVINTRMEQVANKPKISLSKLARDSRAPSKAKPNGTAQVLSTLTKEINQ